MLQQQDFVDCPMNLIKIKLEGMAYQQIQMH